MTVCKTKSIIRKNNTLCYIRSFFQNNFPFPPAISRGFRYDNSGKSRTGIRKQPFNTVYRIGEVCFEDRPCIVAEVGTYDELMKNIMDDADPFPYNLTEEEMDDEVSFFLGEKPYPN